MVHRRLREVAEGTAAAHGVECAMALGGGAESWSNPPDVAAWAARVNAATGAFDRGLAGNFDHRTPSSVWPRVTERALERRGLPIDADARFTGRSPGVATGRRRTRYSPLSGSRRASRPGRSPPVPPLPARPRPRVGVVPDDVRARVEPLDVHARVDTRTDFRHADHDGLVKRGFQGSGPVPPLCQGVITKPAPGDLDIRAHTPRGSSLRRQSTDPSCSSRSSLAPSGDRGSMARWGRRRAAQFVPRDAVGRTTGRRLRRT